jgi:hypothetical protein
MIDGGEEVVIKGGIEFTVIDGGLSSASVKRKLSGDPRPLYHPSRAERVDTTNNITSIADKDKKGK